MLRAFFSCFPSLGNYPSTYSTSRDGYSKTSSIEKDEQIATDIVQILFTADKNSPAFRNQVKDMVQTQNWTENLAKCILDRLVNALNAGAAMGEAMKKSFDRASEEADKFVRQHPVFAAAIVTIVAIGVLVLLLPWVVEALGFGELGPVEGGCCPTILLACEVTRTNFHNK